MPRQAGESKVFKMVKHTSQYVLLVCERPWMRCVLVTHNEAISEATDYAGIERSLELTESDG